MNWLPLALLSALFLGLYDVSKKAALREGSAFSVLLASSYFGSLIALFLLVLSFLFPQDVSNFSLTPLSGAALGLVFLKSLLVSASWLCNFFAQKHLPLSLAAPLRATAPLITLFLAITFLGESPRPLEWLGVGFILISYYSLSGAAKLDGIKLTKNRFVGWLALGTLLGALSGLYDKILLGPLHLPPLSLQLAFTFGNSVVLTLVGVFFRASRSSPREPLPFRREVAAIAACLFLADFAYFHALSEPGALISLVSATRRSSVAVAFLFSGLVFGEKNLKRKSVSVALALLGVVVLALT